MNSTIWKYPLLVTDRQDVRMPLNAAILSVQMQGETLCLWALVNPVAPLVLRTFEVFGTGHPIAHSDEIRKYIGTVQSPGRSLVWHVFERC